MSAKKRRLDQLRVVSPCSTNWDRMSGDEKKRFCAECDKFVYDFSQMTRRQVEAIVSIHKGRMCARITRRPDGSLLTLETPPAHPIVARRAPPAVNATLAAILSLSIPATALNAEVSAAQFFVRSDADIDGARVPYGGGESLVSGIVLDPRVAAIPNAGVKLISDTGAEIETKTSSEGEFNFAKVPFGAYIMLVEAQGFYTHVNSSVIVDTPYNMRFEVTMKDKQIVTIAGGLAGIPPQSLPDLYRQSDLVAVASVGRSVIAGTDNEMNTKQFKTELHISSQLKGQNTQRVIPYYYSTWDDDPAQFKQGERLLVFLQHRESEDGARLDGYEASGWGNSIKKLDDGALAIYRRRIEELTAIFQRGNPDPAELVEWLVRCVEESATRWEGVRKLSESLYTLASKREQENEAESRAGEIGGSDDQTKGEEEDSNEQPDDESELDKESVKLATALTQDHKDRLANALFAIAELSEDDMKLVSLIQELGDERLSPYLVSQLRRSADRAPRLAESLVWMIAHTFNDEDLKQLADDYDDAAEYDESEYDDESDQRGSTRKQLAESVPIAAIKRSAMLKDFLILVEYKTKR